MKKCTTKILSTDQLTDVLGFYNDITDSYLHFEHCVVTLTSNMSGYSAEKIAIECDKIYKHRELLKQKDDQMFDILDLAGSEIANQPIISDYHIALTRANIACNHLYEKLNSIRLSYTDDVTISQLIGSYA